MKFKKAPTIEWSKGPLVLSYECWAATYGLYTFVITKQGDKYKASAKLQTGNMFDGTRIDLGDEIENFKRAKSACETFARKSPISGSA